MAVFALPPDFPPVFHIKLKDQVLLEGEAATLLCLPAACPTPHISWMKGEEVTSPQRGTSGPKPRGARDGEGAASLSSPSCSSLPQTSSPCSQSLQ